MTYTVPDDPAERGDPVALFDPTDPGPYDHAGHAVIVCQLRKCIENTPTNAA